MQLIASRSFLLLASPALGMVSADDTIDRNRALKRHSFIAASVNALQNNTWRAGVNLRFQERRSFGVDLENNAKEYARALREGTLRLAQELPGPKTAVFSCEAPSAAIQTTIQKRFTVENANGA